MMVQLTNLLPLLTQTMSLLQNQLEERLDAKHKGFKISSSAWINENGVGVGSVSCIWDPGGESVDLTIDLIYKTGLLRISTGIYWSNGRMIKEIAETEIETLNINKLLSEAEIYFESINQNALEALLSVLAQQKDEPAG